jgi:hypothetical protein
MSSIPEPVRRNTLPLFSLGLMILITSSILLAAWSSSVALETDASIGAFVIAPFPWLGSSLIFWSLRSAGVNRWLVGGLWGANLVGLALLEFLYLRFVPYGGTPFLLYLVEVLSMAALLLLLHSRWGVLLKGVLLGLGSAALVLFIYGFGRQSISLILLPGEPADQKDPPNFGVSSIVWLGMVVVVPLLALLWSRPPANPSVSMPTASRGRSWKNDVRGVLALLL